MRSSIRHFYEFGPFRLDPQKHRLLREGEVVPLSPKALEALLVLVSNSGKLLEREQLMQALWADTIVEDANLTVTISQLRKTLGKHGETAEYIETVPRVGYRFVADVSKVSEGAAPMVIEKHTLSRTIIEEDLVHDALPPVSSLEVTPPLTPTRAAITGRDPSRFEFRRLTRQPLVVTLAGVLLAALLGGLILRRHPDSSAKTSAAGLKSIAVLPLKSFSAQNEDEELRLRITDALITKLGNLPEISVRPTNSVLLFAKEETGALEAGRRLEVDAVLDGRLQTEGERLRVTLQLVAVQTGEQIWSEQFDGKLNDILNLQDRISAQLLPKLSREQTTALAKNPTTNTEAYENYLKGRYLWNKRNPPEMRQAVAYLEQAVAMDPNFALAYAGLADAYLMLTNYDDLPRSEGYGKAKEMATRALAIDKNLSEGYSALGWILERGEWNWAEAETAFARAIELNPNNAEAHHWRGLILLALGKTEEYFEEMEKARQLAPLTKPISQNYYRVVLKKQGCEKAFEYLERFHALYGNSALERASLSIAHYCVCGDYRQAIAITEQIPIEKLDIKPQTLLAVAYAKTGHRQEALAILERIKKLDSTLKSYLMPYIYVALGDFDSAFASLGEGIAARADGFVKLKYDDFLAPLRSDARFTQLLKKMNLPV